MPRGSWFLVRLQDESRILGRVAATRPKGSLERLRSANRRAVTQLLTQEGPMSRADLARSTGLSRTTVSSLVRDLVATGHVVETTDRGTPHKGGSGRPPLLVALATPPGEVAGVDVGHTHIRVAVANRSAQILAEELIELDVDAHGPAAIEQAARLVESTARAAGISAADLVGVGMCVPAPIDRRSATISTRILRGWADVMPARELEQRLGVPVVADNDANLGALAELHHGAARGSVDVVYVKIASGVGAGLVLGGRLHRGASGIAGEIGHVQLRPDGQVCRCGNRGCLETEVAVPRLLGLLQPAYDDELTTERLLKLDVDGDAGVRRVLNDAGLTVGRALADLCNSLNPESIVVGGVLGSCDSLLQGIRQAVDHYAQPNTAAAVRIESGQLADRAEVMGAVVLAIARVASLETAG
jgi:predicted NBD/HSP70 family sugar kinase